jgi:hypothetical protein
MGNTKLTAGDRIRTWDGHTGFVRAVQPDGWYSLAIDGERQRDDLWHPASVSPEAVPTYVEAETTPIPIITMHELVFGAS